LARQVRDADGARAPLAVVERPETIPLSFAQQRLWFLHKLEGPSATYNMPLALRLSGAVDREALEAALADVVARHEPLRTVFPESEADGKPCQHILPPAQAGIPWDVHQLDDEEELPEALTAAARHAFDLAVGIPFRAWLFVISPTESVVMLLLHHIAGDGWSLGPLARDLVAAYTARRDGAVPSW
ncbi:condensation domain-containing protein, partial [Streptomyces sp. URMC 127]|uniref:condensation domain-containing protein n=1 Tax=Streptomyces sp. URMC 127 TaxID=3423402 RepID=UPI003F1A3948